MKSNDKDSMAATTMATTTTSTTTTKSTVNKVSNSVVGRYRKRHCYNLVRNNNRRSEGNSVREWHHSPDVRWHTATDSTSINDQGLGAQVQQLKEQRAIVDLQVEMTHLGL
jgi:hypothetical protein